MLARLVAIAAVAAASTNAAGAASWSWVPLKGSKCMGGEETGVWMRMGPSGNASTDLGVYLSGGGACFNLETCLAAAHTAKPAAPADTGIWDGNRTDNPFQNYSWIVVPYCTGDVHTGERTAFEDGALRHYHGKLNLELVMKHATSTFKPDQLQTFVVTGESAGGFGAISAYNFLRSFWPFKQTRGVLLDDSGPVLDDTALAPCLQGIWRSHWNINATLPPGCPCVGDKGGLSGIWNYVIRPHAKSPVFFGSRADGLLVIDGHFLTDCLWLQTATRWPRDTFGLISSLKDSTISTFFAYGDLDCKNSIAPIGYDKLAGGLKRLSAGEGGASPVSVYMISGGEHTHTGSKAEFYTKTSGGVSLLSWVGKLVGGENPGSVSPSSED